MKNTQIIFDGSVAQNYDDILGPFIFEPFALNIVDETDIPQTGNVLEIACGTGHVTRHLRERLPKEVTLTATDLNPGMIVVAKQKVTAKDITWQTADMLNLHYDDASFDIVLCQFGVMFAPDKEKALAEMYRVLKKGGTLIFNTWATITTNKPFLITNTVVNSYFGKEPVNVFKEGPFCMDNEVGVLNLLKGAGFNNCSANYITKHSAIKSAQDAANGFITGLPTLNIIQDKIPHLLGDIIAKLHSEFIARLGDHPLNIELNAWLFKAIK